MWQVVQARRRAIHLTETVVSACGRTASFGFPRPPLAPAKSRFALTISFQFLHGRRDPGHGTVRRDCWRSGNEPPEPSSDPGQNSKARVQGRPEIPLSFRLARGGRYPHSTPMASATNQTLGTRFAEIRGWKSVLRRSNNAVASEMPPRRHGAAPFGRATAAAG